MNNSIGKRFRITIFGASHDAEVGVYVEGVPAGVVLPIEVFMADIDRRRPQRCGETPRHEADIPSIEGLDAEGRTMGDVLRISFKNSNIRSRDYDHLRRQPRPSHADLVQMRKYGEECDIAGGGMASGRMTVALVAAGVVAKALLANVEFETRLIEVGGECDETKFDDIISRAAADGDSVGGVVECRISGIREPYGEPFFDSVESVMAHLLFSIPAVKGVEFGDGFDGVRKRGSERNDVIINESGSTYTNNEGGINGGIANGNDIVVRVAIKPTPSIGIEQDSVNLESKQNVKLKIEGRHDACIVPRAVPVIEAITALAIFDSL